MELIKLNDHHFYFHGSVNIGYVRQNNFGLLIDAGLDAQTMKKVIKKLDQLGMPLSHLFITHAHTDHFGGAAYLQKVKKVYTIAPVFEEAIMRYPILEPLYLFQGNKPIEELRNKFLEGEAISIDEIVREGVHEIENYSMEFVALPGHSEYQLGLIIGNTLFAADSYFSKQALHKHKIPFIIDLQDTLKSLEKLKTILVRGSVPGHGEYEENFKKTVQENIDYHFTISQSMMTIISNYQEGLSHEELIRQMCIHWDINLAHISAWTLYRTAITAYLTALLKDNEISLSIKNYSLWIQKREGEA